MKIPSIGGLLYHFRDLLDFKNPDHFLWQARGVIHVGANAGFEREDYHRKMLDVVWIEPIPSVFENLCANIHKYPRQKALQALITNCEGKKYDFNISCGSAVSSSILDLSEHRILWPDVDYIDSMEIVGTTLPHLVADYKLDLAKYDALVLDTQGSELLVLQGARDILNLFKYIKTEAADFESYKGCCKVDELGAFLREVGFEEISRNCFQSHQGHLNYFDLVYKRKDFHPLLPFRFPM